MSSPSTSVQVNRDAGGMGGGSTRAIQNVGLQNGSTAPADTVADIGSTFIIVAQTDIIQPQLIVISLPTEGEVSLDLYSEALTQAGTGVRLAEPNIAATGQIDIATAGTSALAPFGATMTNSLATTGQPVVISTDDGNTGTGTGHVGDSSKTNTV